MAPSIILPPLTALDVAAAELVNETSNETVQRALNKAIWQFHQGLRIIPTTGALLVPSFRDSGIIYRVSHVYGCSCRASRTGRSCKHAEAIRIVERAQTRAIPMADRIAAARHIAREKAQREMDELFA